MAQTFIVTAPDGTEHEITAPDGATQEEVLAYAKQQLGGQPALSPMQLHDERVKDANRLRVEWLQATGGRLKPGQTEAQAIQEWSGVAPATSADFERAQHEELAAGGDLRYGESLQYGASKLAASMGGYAAGGPLGATSAEAFVRYTALTENLGKAIKAGAVTEDRAAEILAREMLSGTTEDAAWNLAIPFFSQVVRRIPGIQSLASKVIQKLKPGAKTGTDLAEQRAGKVAERVKDAQTPAQKEAVEGLSARSGEHVLTPGQVRGRASAAEGAARVGSLEKFDQQQEALRGAAEGMRGELVNPPGQPTREALGDTVQSIAKQTQQKVKERLRPVFKAADNLGVRVDFSDVAARAKAALAADAAVPGGRLAGQERAALEEIVASLEGKAQSGLLSNSQVGAEAALDFISRQKERLRSMTADWKPSEFYATVVNGLVKSADDAFTAAANAAGKPGVAAALRNARADYREMMSTIYDDALKLALKKNPEDVGRFFWQKGNVSEPKQLAEMLAMAKREGVLAGKAVSETQGAMARGFLQEAVPNVDAAAKWSQKLRENPALRDTWNALTSGQGGAELRHGMEVLEEAAKMASRGNPELLGSQIASIPLRRAAGWGVGVSLVTGTVSPWMMAAGLSVAGLMKAMATAYTQGNKGALNLIMRVLRTNSAGTAASTKALQELLPKLEQTMTELKVDPSEVFVEAPQELAEQAPR